MLPELTECTVLMLKVIHDMYRKQALTYEEFLSFTEKKIQFLSDNINFITSEIERKNADDIIHKCNSLMSKSSADEYMQ